MMKWSDFSKERKLISIHVPKVGGKTFRAYLEKVFGEDLYIYKTVENKGKIYLGRFLDASCVHGHFCYSDFEGLKTNHTFITWMRDPLQQAISAYYFFQRVECEHYGISKEKAARIPFESFIHTFPGQLGFTGPSLEPYVFVGITDYYSTSIELFRKMFGIEVPYEEESCLTNLNPEKKNVGQSYGAAEDLREKFYALREKEIELYQAALEKFKALCGKYSIALQPSFTQV